MIHLIWSLINILLVLYFLYLIIGFITKGKRVFTSQFKAFSILIMVIGVVQIISGSNSKKSTNLITITNDYNKKNTSEIKKVVLDDHLTFDIHMLVTYSIEENTYIPIESNSFLSGFVSGYVWEFKSIQIHNHTSNEEPKFVANGILKWNLFGYNVYNQSKTFSGIIK